MKRFHVVIHRQIRIAQNWIPGTPMPRGYDSPSDIRCEETFLAESPLTAVSQAWALWKKEPLPEAIAQGIPSEHPNENIFVTIDADDNLVSVE